MLPAGWVTPNYVAECMGLNQVTNTAHPCELVLQVGGGAQPTCTHHTSESGSAVQGQRAVEKACVRGVGVPLGHKGQGVDGDRSAEGGGGGEGVL